MRHLVAQVLFVLFLVALTSNVRSQQVWKWVDSKGVTHYSDQPAPGAVRVDLHVQTYDSGPVEKGSSSTPSKIKEVPAPSYRGIHITQPANDDTLTGTGGVVTILVQVDPALQPGHAVLVTIDGIKVFDPSTASSFTLTEVPRGTHTLVASIVDGSGDTILSGDAVQFHMQLPVVRQRK